MSRQVVSLGCRLNSYESGIIQRHVNAAGLDDAFVVNSCAVTTEAVRQSRQAIRRLRRDNPDATLVATGCAAQINSREFADMEEVDFVLGNREKMQASSFRSLVAGDSPRIQVGDIMEATQASEAAQPLPEFNERARAFLQVQNGCDHRCTFCVIPFGRGNARSMPAREVAARAREITRKGFAEITLTGVDLTAYGQDLESPMRLGDLLAHLLDAVPEARRLRLSSLDAIELDPLALELLESEERLLPHVHLSLQSGDDIILKRMKRRHSRKDAIDLCDRLRGRRSDIVFGADLIAGFPTETEAMFRQTERLVDECGLTWLHVFAFSPRPGTPAARMPP
ncbi:MAG: tRNA (N(6)-L-threonylcarbamoyladenosine(37)-C(2))-methylthiotransferase MtaB, partial [Hyphomicrobiales bacterium]|nr:tRNA (N(6)-L-threonylcarbamoyladenosine(37)-C(2))-methylthiotransferase MtaB [Hyphomicrobiales bacterium]MCY4049696.1 tRNA (N(6)-L-threonylcarbamoyladenosine(37)-C(2))-methylthiotransferase MtaB [Hyphomicrobiales bacterium]